MKKALIIFGILVLLFLWWYIFKLPAGGPLSQSRLTRFDIWMGKTDETNKPKQIKQ